MTPEISQYTKLSELIDAFRNSANPTIIDREIGGEKINRSRIGIDPRVL